MLAELIITPYRHDPTRYYAELWHGGQDVVRMTDMTRDESDALEAFGLMRGYVVERVMYRATAGQERMERI